MQPDMTSTAEIHECLVAKELLPSERFVDSAYVDAGLLDGRKTVFPIPVSWIWRSRATGAPPSTRS